MNDMPTILTDHISICGEGPLWDAAGRKLYWIDILSGEVLCFSSKDKQVKPFNTGQKIGSIALASSGNIIAALKSGFYSIDFDSASLRSIVNPEAGHPENRFNDGKCDPGGRFWAGSMSDRGLPHAGNLYTLEKDGSVTKKLELLSITNGMAWNLSKGQYYHIDTPTRQVFAYDYHNESGAIRNGRPVIEIEDQEGVPDGMTIDAEGMLWIAHWNGGKVSRWDPEKSLKLQELFLPVSKVTSCAFGGDGLGDLYVTTARVGLSKEELIRQPLAGATFVFKQIDVKGVPEPVVDDSSFF